MTRPAEVLIAQEAHDAMVAAGLAALPRETGGILAGYRTGDSIVVTRAIVVPDDHSSGHAYLRRRRAAAAALEALRAVAPEVIGYVGEWHTHPADQPPSGTDTGTLQRAAQVARDVVALVVVPFTHGRPQALRALVGRRVGRRYAVKSAATARTSPTTAAELEARAQAPKDHTGEQQPMTTASAQPGTFDIRGTFIGHSKMMAAAFEIARAASNHGPTLGDAAEDAWRSMLQQFLPKRYCVTKGFVVDSQGRRSDQIDVIIHDRHFSPVFCTPGDVLFVPAESVYAVFEIKQDLSKANIEYAAQKAASVRRLHRTSAPIRQLSQASAIKEPPRILAGILTGRNGWETGFGGPLVSALALLEGAERLDLGCVLDTGAFEAPEAAAASELDIAPEDVGLATFAMRLIARLNDMGTIPAVDVSAYTAQFLSPVDQATPQPSADA